MPQLLLAAGTMALMVALVVYQARKVRCLREHGTLIAAMVTSVRHETGKTGWGFTRDNYYVTATRTNPRTGPHLYILDMGYELLPDLYERKPGAGCN
jgi:hypothetical protein